MSYLQLAFLGAFQVMVAGAPVTGFESDKVRALLAYLATESEQPHRREVLAALLWPQLDSMAARGNLRHALANLRRVLNDYRARPPYLLITHQALQFNRHSHHVLDVATFQDCLGHRSAAPEDIPRFETAVDLYRGEFLCGFSLADSIAFDEWLLFKREEFQYQMLGLLHRLAELYTQRGQYDRALIYARRQVGLEPYGEAAQRQLMHLLALSGQRHAALEQYGHYRARLAEDLVTAPATETTALYERIRQGKIAGALPLRNGMVRGYRLLDQIGEGVYGPVYRAIQPFLEREVALKIILPQFAHDPAFARRFRREAQIIAQLEHPHTVPLYDYWQGPDGAFLVMRWMRGGNLTQRLAQGRCELATAVDLVEQIAAALHIAHQQNIVHRDLRPSNILLDEAGNAYLSDFGVGNAGISTPAYIAPEQVRAEDVTPAADLYNLGIILYELLVGRHPFAGTPVEQLAARHVADPLPQLHAQFREVPTAVDEVIQRATAKDPAARFATAAALAQALNMAAAG